MAVNTALIRAAIYAATDRRTWILVCSVICGVVFLIVAVVAAFLNMFYFDGSAYNEASPAYVEFVSTMKECYLKLDTEVTELNEIIEGEKLDQDQIHAVFYALYFGEAKSMNQDFYRQFVECFTDRSTTDGVETIAVCDKNTAYIRLEAVTQKPIPLAYRNQIEELYSVLKYGAGISGYDVDSGDITGPSAEAYSNSTFSMLMKEATKYIGYPYVWGGSSPSTSFDCSGFVCWVYTKSGMYNLPRTTAQGIYNQCTKISANEAKPGDLVFFTRTYVSSEPVTHIGIYVGDGKMLHCGDPIKYSTIKTEFWKSHFYGFGRLN